MQFHRVMMGIYVIQSPTNAIYVGQSRNIEKRWSQYKKLKCKDQPRIYNSLKKHGADKHEFMIVNHLSDKTPQFVYDHYEQVYMDVFRDNGYDLMNLKEGGANGKLSEESKKKLSESLKGKNTWTKGRKLSKEQIEAMKERRKLQVFSKEDKEKIAKSLREYYRCNPHIGMGGHSSPMKGRKQPKEFGDKLSKMFKGVPRHTEEFKIKMRIRNGGENNFFYGKKHTEETKKIISESRIGKYLGENNPNFGKGCFGAKNGRAKIVLQYNLDGGLIAEHLTISFAAKAINCNMKTLSANIKKKDGLYKGYIWKLN